MVKLFKFDLQTSVNNISFALIAISVVPKYSSRYSSAENCHKQVCECCVLLHTAHVNLQEPMTTPSWPKLASRAKKI